MLQGCFLCHTGLSPGTGTGLLPPVLPWLPHLGRILAHSSNMVRSEFPVPCIFGLPRCPDLSTSLTLRQEQSCYLCRQWDPVPMPQPPCTPPTLHLFPPRTALTFFHPDLELLKSSSSEPSSESLLGFLEKSRQHWQADHRGHCQFPVHRSGDLARSRQRGEQECCRRRQGDGAAGSITN